MNQSAEVVLPWYRQFWFWFVFGPLIFIIVLCCFTVTMAFHYADDVVTDNYYKTGLMINQTLKQDERAAALGLSADIQFDQATGEVLLSIQGNETFPTEMILFLDNPVKKAKDQHVLLKQVAPGQFRGDLATKVEYSWYLALVPISDVTQRKHAEWLLTGEVNLAKGNRAHLQSRVDDKPAE